MQNLWTSSKAWVLWSDKANILWEENNPLFDCNANHALGLGSSVTVETVFLSQRSLHIGSSNQPYCDCQEDWHHYLDQSIFVTILEEF